MPFALRCDSAVLVPFLQITRVDFTAYRAIDVQKKRLNGASLIPPLLYIEPAALALLLIRRLSLKRADAAESSHAQNL